MKFVTKRVYRSWNYQPWDKAFAAYEQHLNELEKVLPEPIIALADPSLLDDGLIVKIDHHRQKRKLTLTLRCGNLQIGYYDVVITYVGATVTPKHDQTLAQIARSTNGFCGYGHDIHFHEFTVAKSRRITHRFLFNPGIQFAISCKSLTWKKIPRKSRKLVRVDNRYIGGPL